MNQQDKKEFREIFQEYQKDTQGYLESKLGEFHKETRNYIEKKLEESDQKTREYVKKILEESTEETERYIGALSESHQHTLDAISEQTKDIPEMKRVIDMMFENMGKQEMDIAVLKESARNHERRLQKVEG